MCLNLCTETLFIKTNVFFVVYSCTHTGRQNKLKQFFTVFVRFCLLFPWFNDTNRAALALGMLTCLLTAVLLAGLSLSMGCRCWGGEMGISPEKGWSHQPMLCLK